MCKRVSLEKWGVARGGGTVWDNNWGVFDVFKVLPYPINILGLLFEIEFLG